MKKINWQYFIDPVSTELSQYLIQTAMEHPVLKADIEELSISYKAQLFPVYRVGKGFFNLIYQGRKSYLKIYGHNLRFFKREGNDGPIHLINNQALKSATKRSVKKKIKLLIGSKRT